MIYLGDFRLGDMFHNVTGRDYGLDAWEDGAKGWNRFNADNFGWAPERFLVTGAIGPCVDMDAQLAELDWMADHRFVGVYGPGYLRHPDMPPVSDPYWDPFWAKCVERGLTVVVHAGYGTMQGTAFSAVERIYNDVADAAGSTDQEALYAHADAVSQESLDFFFNFLNKNVDSRRPMWQMMLGGVFDRFPELKVLLTEIRLDWIPATLAHLDAVYDQHRDQLPAQRRPSEYWPTNFMAGASFIHKAEVDHRHELGVDTILFGRDFPHPEGTWPHTREFLRAAFTGRARRRGAQDARAQRHPLPRSRRRPARRHRQAHRSLHRGDQRRRRGARGPDGELRGARRLPEALRGRREARRGRRGAHRGPRRHQLSRVSLPRGSAVVASACGR